MANNSKILLEETEKLNRENAALRQQLSSTRETIEAIKTGNIDALVLAHENALKVYTEKTADKPYRILIEKMHEGAVTLYENGTILYCNSSFAKMVNLPLQRVVGSVFENFIDNSSKKHVKALLKQGSLNAYKDEAYLYPVDGDKIPVLMTINALMLDKTFVLSIILTDLTIQNENQEKLRHQKEQLEQKNKELQSINQELAFQISEKEKRGAELNIAKTDVKEQEELNTHKESILATLSHDLRSPLTGIIGLADELKENFDNLNHNEIKELINLLYKASTDELNMLDYLVEWARIKYASEAYSPAKIKLVTYVRKVFNTLKENAVAKNLHLHTGIDKKITVFADAKMLLSILQNIISNSIKHTPPNGKITVTATREKDKIFVEINDTGIGMTDEIKEKLFTPQMSSLSNARKENKGAGIGLLLVKGFLEKNGGEIWVESIEGEGSSFYFTLPARKSLNKKDSSGKAEFPESLLTTLKPETTAFLRTGNV